MEFELRKIKIVRIAASVLQMYRVLQILLAYFFYSGFHFSTEEIIYASGLILLLILFVANKFPIITPILLAYFLPRFDIVFFSYNFSTEIFKLLCIFYALWAWRYQYFNSQMKLGDPTILRRELDKIYLLIFMVFGILNIFSTVVHLNSIYWQSGDALGAVLTHPYFSRFSNFFRNWFTQSPDSFLFITRLFSYSLLVSQFVLIPLYFWKTTRTILFLWMLSLLFWMFFMLEISFFAWFTFLLFVIIFIRKDRGDFGTALWRISGFTLGMKRLYYIAVAAASCFILLKFPYISVASDKVFWFFKEWDTKVFVTKKLKYVGLFEPDIFNDNHMEGAQKWFVIHRIKSTGKELVPFFGENGEKLCYFKFEPLALGNHGSDFIYYGNTLPYAFGVDSFNYKNSTLPYKMKGYVYQRLLRLDRAFQSGDSVRYRVDFWERTAPNKSGVISWNFETKKVRTEWVTLGRNKKE